MNKYLIFHAGGFLLPPIVAESREQAIASANLAAWQVERCLPWVEMRAARTPETATGKATKPENRRAG